MKAGIHLIHRDESGQESEFTLPDWDWLWENFPSKSGAIRYMHHLSIPTAIIARYLGLNYRHVYSVIAKSKAATNKPGHKVCPVCHH